MTISVRNASAALLRHAVENATRAPSVHNTQPWRFVIRGDIIELHADRTRQLRVLDPRGRQLAMSCGCALFNIRVALSSRNMEILRLPDATRRDLLAVVVPGEPPARPTARQRQTAALDRFVGTRRTNRREFGDEPMAYTVERRLLDAARYEGVHLTPVCRPAQWMVVTALTQLADRIESLDPAYLAELQAWTTSDPHRDDGVPVTSVARSQRESHPELPLRNFDLTGRGVLPTHRRARPHGRLFVLGTDDDDPSAWLRAGEALERVLLEVTRAGLAASPVTQVVEVCRTRAALRRELAVHWWPQMVLRIGQAAPTPATRRRPLADVLVEP